MAQAAAQKSAVSRLEYASGLILPWILSSATHVAVLLGLALSVKYTTAFHRTGGAPHDDALQVNFVAESDEEPGGDAMQFAQPGDPQENDNNAEASETPLGSSHPKPSLADVLRERPHRKTAGRLGLIS